MNIEGKGLKFVFTYKKKKSIGLLIIFSMISSMLPIVFLLERQRAFSDILILILLSLIFLLISLSLVVVLANQYERILINEHSISQEKLIRRKTMKFSDEIEVNFKIDSVVMKSGNKTIEIFNTISKYDDLVLFLKTKFDDFSDFSENKFPIIVEANQVGKHTIICLLFLCFLFSIFIFSKPELENYKIFFYLSCLSLFASCVYIYLSCPLRYIFSNNNITIIYPRKKSLIYYSDISNIIFSRKSNKDLIGYNSITIVLNRQQPIFLTDDNIHFSVESLYDLLKKAMDQREQERKR